MFLATVRRSLANIPVRQESLAVLRESGTILAMPTFIDLDTWPRRELFEFYRDYDKPFFNVCTRLDVTNLLREMNNLSGVSVALAYHYFALKAANEIEQFRYRLRDGRVLVHDVINGGTTLMLPNETFTLVYFDYAGTFAEFIGPAQRAVIEAKKESAFRPRHEDDARIHCTTLPWISFTSFSHARKSRREDSVPKISFGKFTRENDRTVMPFSVEVHHALVDGLHVGRYITRMEELLAEPQLYLRNSH
jgi:chloramphenicol O-acetyltransferase type A